MVSGGAVVVGNGVVDVLSGGTANIAFLANGSGGLEIADSPGNVSAFTGTVSGFGGMNHTNHKQFIDLVSVTSAPDTISLSYAARRRQRHAVRLERRRGGGADQHDRQLHVGELQRQGRQQRQCGDRRPDGAEWRQRRAGARASLPAARHRSAGHRLRRADHARLCEARCRHRRHLDRERRPPRRERSRFSAATSPEASSLPPTAMAARWSPQRSKRSSRC